MIRDLLLDDISQANVLLSKFNYEISESSFDNVFLKALVYIDNGIKGILVYDLVYDRIDIEYIIVDERYRLKGIGTKLLQKIEKNDVKNITLEVRESNIAAINFYKKNGFEVKTIRKNYYNNENGYLMLKELGE